MMRFSVFIVCLLLSIMAFSQKYLDVRFVPYLSGMPLKVDSLYIIDADSITISQCRFYISGISIKTKKGVFQFSDEAILVDADSDRTIAKLLFDGDDHTRTIEFQFGTDSVMNVSGALSGALDPMHGMYWTWQSGYINMKLEGKSSKSADRKKQFEFHIGGYSAPFNSMQKVSLSVPDKQEIIVVLDLDEFFRKADLQKTHHIMRPCAEAVSLSRLLAANFRSL